MHRYLIAASLLAASVGLSACVVEGPSGCCYGGATVQYTHHPVGFDSWYDGFYGPIHDGYWGDGGFYYSRAKGEPYQLDKDGHFRREGGIGFGIHIHGGIAVGADVGVSVH